MDKAEAKLYFQANEDLREQYEEQLFGFKQYFLQKSPLTKLYHSKLQKLKLLNEAYEAVGGKLNAAMPLDSEFQFSDEVEEAFHLYHKNRNTILRELIALENGKELEQLILSYLSLYRVYATMWRLSGDLNPEGILISKEPDPMILLQAIKENSSGKRLTFDEVRSGKISGELINEAKRLTLWLKSDQENGRL